MLVSEFKTVERLKLIMAGDPIAFTAITALRQIPLTKGQVVPPQAC